MNDELPRLMLYIRILIGVAGFAIVVDFVALGLFVLFRREWSAVLHEMKDGLDIVKMYSVHAIGQKNETTAALGKMVDESAKTNAKIDEATRTVVTQTSQKIEEVKQVVGNGNMLTPDAFPFRETIPAKE